MDKKNMFLRLFLAGFFIIGIVAITSAAGSGGSSGMGAAPVNPASSLFEKGVQADKAGDYKSALNYFQKAVNLDRNNPDIYNMLAHSQRKLGMIDEALDNYKKALSLRPNFPEAREYLGEAYIQAALREIEILKGYGKAGDEFRDDLIKALQDAATNLQ